MGVGRDSAVTTFVIIPAMNEAAVIASVVADVRRFTPEIIVVDDCSQDDTGRVAREAGAIVLRHLINRGQGASIQTGIDYALRHGAQILVTFDADGQHSADDLSSLISPIESRQADFVLGSRFLSDNAVPPLRKLTLKLAIVFTRLTSGLRVTDAHNGLRAFSRRGAEKIHIQLDRMAHASEIMDQIRDSRLPYTEVPVSVRYTEYARRKGQRGIHAFRVAVDYLFGRWVR
jgi:glycosyltransferase involved in cell wall biosynthesis